MNEERQVGDWWLVDEQWRQPFDLARSTCSVVGLSALVCGEWLMSTYVHQSGLVSYKLWYRPNKEARHLLVGWWVLDYLPERKRTISRPVKTHGREMWIRGKRLDEEMKYQARVWVDADGLPWPLPLPVWEQLAAQLAAGGAP